MAATDSRAKAARPPALVSANSVRVDPTRLPFFVENVFTRVDLISKILGDGLRDFGRAGVEAVDYQGLHRDGLVSSSKVFMSNPG
jgi:hypothetical protein